MIGLTVIIEIIIFVLMCLFIGLASTSYEHEVIFGIIAITLLITLIGLPIAIGTFHGWIDYKASNDKDLARITAITQEQDMFKTYYKVEVEYLTNTAVQDGAIQKKNIEKDTFYCYYENQELVQKLKDNLYKEVWIISGYKGGYENYKDFGTKLIKDVQIKEE